MIKKILILLALIATSIYLVLAVTVFNTKHTDMLCGGIDMEIKDEVNYGFISLKDIESTLKGKKLLSSDKNCNEINIKEIERTLKQNSFIKNAECYITAGGKVKVDIYQRIPLMRVMSNNGDNYYIDNEGKIMNAQGKAAHVAIATGSIDRKFAQEKLFLLAKFIQENDFWNCQIEQINVTSKQEIEIVPRVGNHILFIGKPEMLDKKFRKLKAFYSEGLNNIGWNKYKQISVEFDNQIICTKKEK